MKNSSLLTYLGIFLVFISSNLEAQEFELSIATDYASFDMGNFKEYQELTSLSLPGVRPKINDAFPSYFNYSISIGKFFNNRFQAGLKAGYQSTGGRVSYEDYSGEFRSDQLMNSTTIGLYIKTPVRKNSRLHVNLDAGILFSNLEFSESFRVLTDSDSYSFDLESTGAYSGITVSYMIPIWGFSISPRVGYMLNFSNVDFHLEDDNDAKLILPNDISATPNWSGFRIGFEIGFQS